MNHYLLIIVRACFPILIMLTSCQNVETHTTKTQASETPEVADSTLEKQVLADEKQALPAKEQDKQADIAEQIVTTSPTFLKMTKGLAQRIVKNGGTSFGISLESSPDEKNNSYHFELHESYPDRSVTFARFFFNVEKQELTLYNGVEDVWKPIAFDRKWLSQFKKDKK